MAKPYRFIEETHTHMIGDVVVPGITTIIKPLTNYEDVPEHILKPACAYGSAVHKTIELYCQDALDLNDLDVILKGSIQGFSTWLKDYKLKKGDFIVELPMGDPALMIGCIPDLILDGRLIVEIKTRKVNHLTDSIQTVCQEHVWKKNGGSRIKNYERRVLELRQDGSYAYSRVDGEKQAMARFRLLLDHYWNTQTINSWKG